MEYVWLGALLCECGYCFVLLDIYCLLEPLPLTHVFTHAYHAFIYDPACSIHVHTCIHDCLVWFGSLLVNLGGFRGQIKSWHLYASRWPPRAHKFSPLYYKYVPYISTSCTLIERSVISTIYVCYFILFYCFLAYFMSNLCTRKFKVKHMFIVFITWSMYLIKCK